MSEREQYERPSHWAPDGPLSERDQIERIASTARLVPADTGSVLDVGCGNGVFLRHLEDERKGLELHGLERSEAARRAKLCEATVLGGSVDRLPFPDRSVDLVSALEVIEHLPHGIYEEGLKELARVARRFVLISVPYREIRRRIACPSCGCRFDPNYHVREFDRARMDDLLAGFAIERVELIHIAVFPLPRLVRRLRAIRPLSWREGVTCPQCSFVSPARTAAAARAAAPGRGWRLIRFGRRAKWIAALYRRVG